LCESEADCAFIYVSVSDQTHNNLSNSKYMTTLQSTMASWSHSEWLHLTEYISLSTHGSYQGSYKQKACSSLTLSLSFCYDRRLGRP